MAVDVALRNALRRLPGGSSLSLLLAEHFGARNVWTRPDLSLLQILAWADAHRARCGKWPGPYSGAIPEAPGETWCAVNHALLRGTRGLPGGLSLADRQVADEPGGRDSGSSGRDVVGGRCGAARRRPWLARRFVPGALVEPPSR